MAKIFILKMYVLIALRSRCAPSLWSGSTDARMTARENAIANLGVGARVALRASDMCLRHVIFASRVILPSAVIFAFGELFMR